MNDNQNTNDSNPPNEDQNQGNFETDSNWTDVRSQQDDDDIIFIEDEEINKVEDEIFGEGDEDEESKKDGEESVSEVVKSVPTDHPKLKFNYHKDSVYSLALCGAKSSIFASGGGDDIAVVWTFDNIENPVLNTLVGHNDTVDKLGFNFDGKYIATAALDGEIIVWDYLSGQKKFNLDGPTQDISFIEWHSKGNVIVAGSSDNSIWLWNGSNGAFMNVFQGHTGGVTCGGFTPDGKQVISASEDCTLRIWNPKTAECVYNIKGYGFHEGPINVMAFSSSGNLVATGSADKTVCISNISTGKSVARTAEHGASVEGLVFPAIFDVIGTCSLDGYVRIFDVNKFSLKEKWNMDIGLNKIEHYKEKNLFISSSIDGRVFLFDHRISDPVAKIHCHASCIQDFKILPSGEILSADDDGKIFAYDIRNQKEYAILESQKQTKAMNSNLTEENLPTIESQLNTEETKEIEIVTEKEVSTEKTLANEKDTAVSETVKENNTTSTTDPKDQKVEANEEVKESK